MKTFITTLSAVLLLICPAITTHASPAYPGLVKGKQPDGTTISVYVRGDEKVHWMESEDGYSLLYDNNRAIVYAISNENGDMVPSSVVARDISLRSSSDQVFLKEIPKKLAYSSSQVNMSKSIWTMVQSAKESVNTNQLRALAGDVRAICTLISFSDKAIQKTKNDFNNLMNQTNYTATGDKGSVKDYYYENSYGKVNLIITVAGPYTVSKTWDYYGTNDPATEDDYISRVREFATEAANLTFKSPGNNPVVNPADYDNDGDGTIDAFHIIYAGYGEESTHATETRNIWAHKSVFSTPLTFGTKSLKQYSCSPELRGSSGTNITHIGVICHEMGHIFGSPDFYDTSSSGLFTGTGNWDLMASGSWNNDGACPAHINMYQKIKMGWVTPVILNSARAITGMSNSAIPDLETVIAYQYATTTSGEYYVLENRQQTGFDSYVPGHGLLIYHASVITNSDLSSNTVNAGSLQKMYPVCASATTNPAGTPDSYGKINSAGCPFPGSSVNTSFTDYTIPSAVSWKGANTQKPVTEIQEKNQTISFNFMMQDAEPVSNLQKDISGQSVKLTWTKPVDNTVIGYNIYRDNVLLIKLGNNNTSYTQYNVNSGTYNYCVTALYTGKESSPVCQSVTIVNSPAGGSNYLTAQNLTAQNVNGNKDIQLNWQTPFVNAWATFAGNFYTTSYIPSGGSQFSSVVRFSTDSIQKFQGSSLTKVRFAMKNLQCKYAVQIWWSDPEMFPAGAPVANQAVNNPATTNNNFEVTLNTPIALVSNKDLWIGIQYTLNPMTYVAGIDAGPSVPYSNYAYIGNSWSPMSDNSNNWYIAGYMDFGSGALKAPADNWLRASNATAATGSNYIVYRDNKQIATPTQSTYTDSNVPAGNHIYCVSIKYSDGTESEQTCVQAVSLNPVAMVPVNPEVDINIYPNPVQRGENLIIHCDPLTSSTLSIYSISGQLLQQEQIIGPDVQKKMDFIPGIYVLQINNNSKTLTRKIIIK